MRHTVKQRVLGSVSTWSEGKGKFSLLKRRSKFHSAFSASFSKLSVIDFVHTLSERDRRATCVADYSSFFSAQSMHTRPCRQKSQNSQPRPQGLTSSPRRFSTWRLLPPAILKSGEGPGDELIQHKGAWAVLSIYLLFFDSIYLLYRWLEVLKLPSKLYSFTRTAWSLSFLLLKRIWDDGGAVISVIS